MRHGVGGFRAALAPLAAGAVLAACGGGERPTLPPDPAPIRPPAVTDLRDIGAREIRVTGHWLTPGAGAVWLSSARSIQRLDPGTGRRSGAIRVPQEPCQGTAIASGVLWTATCGRPGVARIVLAAGRVTRHVALDIPGELGGEASIAAGAGGVWVVVDAAACRACRLARLDPVTLRVTARIAIAQGSAAVRVGAGRVWVSNPERDVVQVVDPASIRVIRTVAAGDMPRFLTVGRRSAWTLNQADGTLTRIAARSGRTTTVDAGVHGSGGDLASGAGWLWARGSERMLTRVDPATRQVIERYGPDSALGAVAVGFGAVWVSAKDLRLVWRLPLTKVARESPQT